MFRVDKRVYYINTIYCIYLCTICIYTSRYIYIYKLIVIYYKYLYIYLYYISFHLSFLSIKMDHSQGRVKSRIHGIGSLKSSQILCRSTSNHDATSTAAEDRDGSRHGPSVLTMGILDGSLNPPRFIGTLIYPIIYRGKQIHLCRFFNYQTTV